MAHLVSPWRSQHPYDVMWNVIGFGGQAIFGVRFLIQWLKSEQEGHSVIPIAFWYCSLIGGLIQLLLCRPSAGLAAGAGPGPAAADLCPQHLDDLSRPLRAPRPEACAFFLRGLFRGFCRRLSWRGFLRRHALAARLCPAQEIRQHQGVIVGAVMRAIEQGHLGPLEFGAERRHRRIPRQFAQIMMGEFGKAFRLVIELLAQVADWAPDPWPRDPAPPPVWSCRAARAGPPGRENRHPATADHKLA